MGILSEHEERRLVELRFLAASGGYTPTEKSELAELEQKAAGFVHVPVKGDGEFSSEPVNVTVIENEAPDDHTGEGWASEEAKQEQEEADRDAMEQEARAEAEAGAEAEANQQ